MSQIQSKASIDWDLYKKLKKLDPFYIYDIITDNKIPQHKEEALEFIKAKYGNTNYTINKFHESGKLEAFYFQISIDMHQIYIGFLDTKKIEDFDFDQSLFRESFSAFHNDTMYRLGLIISTENFLKMEDQYNRSNKLDLIFNNI